MRFQYAPNHKHTQNPKERRGKRAYPREEERGGKEEEEGGETRTMPTMARRGGHRAGQNGEEREKRGWLGFYKNNPF